MPRIPSTAEDAHVDMVGVIGALVAEERRREREGGPRLPLRPDHGHQLHFPVGASLLAKRYVSLQRY
ncbi:hypothetical protein ACEI36_03225 [Pseudomonas kielensis]|uniref:hypothetical protein n=1 Tax=Pseudomonas kielensis TaxID=2762577 RepID=UPI0038A2DE61